MCGIFYYFTADNGDTVKDSLFQNFIFFKFSLQRTKYFKTEKSLRCSIISKYQDDQHTHTFLTTN